MAQTQAQRIQAELKKAGAGSIGRLTPESNELLKLIHPNEHIGGVVYGVYPGGLAWLVATDQRVLFLDRKPLFATHDELTYDIVVGTTSLRAGPFVSVVLHTRIHDYALRFVNPKSARIFMDFVEHRRLISGAYDYATMRHTLDDDEQKPIKPGRTKLGSLKRSPALQPSAVPLLSPRVSGDKELKFLREHELGVLSTVDRTGNVDGAVVYYHVDSRNFVYILTKAGTAKGRGIYAHSQVALTVYEAENRQTLQLQGIAEVENDQLTKDNMFMKLTNPHLYGNKIELPPVTKLHEGAFMIVRITPTQLRFHDYSEQEI